MNSNNNTIEQRHQQPATGYGRVDYTPDGTIANPNDYNKNKNKSENYDKAKVVIVIMWLVIAVAALIIGVITPHTGAS
jgi:hypothetical protein